MTALREEPGKVVVEDPAVAGLLGLVYPRQETTVFGWQNTYAGLAPRKFAQYAAARQALLGDPRFAPAIAQLDALYRYESEDFILIHNRRKTHFHLQHDAASTRAEAATDLRVFVGGVRVSIQQGK